MGGGVGRAPWGGRGALLAAALLACSPGGEEAAPATGGEPSAPPARYVGSETCGGCHPAELARWRGSHHDLAMQPAGEDTVLGDFGGATFSRFGVTSSFFRRDGRFVVRTEGPDGALHDYEVAYTFGVEPLQQYLVAFPGGRYQALPLAWDARPARVGGQRWFHLQARERVAPGDPLHWTGSEYNWNSRCAECHSTDVEKGYRAEEDRYETRFAEVDVACEACHGPGSAHVAWAGAAEGGGSGDEARRGLAVDLRGDGATWELAPGSAIAQRSAPRRSHAEVETCARCHARRAPIAAQYVHGRPLLDSHRPALLEEGLYFPDGQIQDEVYVYGSFLQSRMYARGVTCSDCHEPHGLALRAEGNELCGRCHRPERFESAAHHGHAAGSPGAQCAACHMPTRRYMVVDPRHDHGFRVPRPDLAAALGTPDACTGCHADRSPAWAAEVLAGREGARRPAGPHFAEVIAAGRAGALAAEGALARLARDDGQPAIVRATALQLLAEQGPLGPGAAAAVERGLADPDPLLRLGALEAAEGLAPGARLAGARPLLRDPVRGVRIQAARALAALPPQAWAPGERSDLADALAEYRAAQLASAERPEAHLNLGVLHAGFGELDAARREYETALRLAPWFVPAYVNLADLARLEGRDEEGERVLLEGLRRAPQSAELHHALGLLRARQQRRPEALASLQRAAELAPGRTRFAYAYGVALSSAGQGDAALAVLARAHAGRPGDRDVLVALATLHRDRGETQEALVYARRLAERSPGDPEAEALVAELEAQAGGS